MNELLPLYDADEMRALDAGAIGLGIPAAVLMERAGVAAAAEILERHPPPARVAIVAGSGNNGGDGFVVARHLQSAGLDVEVNGFEPWISHVISLKTVMKVLSVTNRTPRSTSRRASKQHCPKRVMP